MKAPVNAYFILFFAALLVTGCNVTEEKIELWKGTQNGPKKLADTVGDSSVPAKLRAKAGVALVQINEWNLFRKTFSDMPKEDRDEIVLIIAPMLGEISKGSVDNEASGPSKEQVDAKDGLYNLLEYAGPKSLAAVQDPLISWCTQGNLNVRYKAGNYTISAVAKKVGARAADQMTKLLTMDQVAISHIAKLIREINDAAALNKASLSYGKTLLKNVKKITEAHLLAAASIGGTGVANALVALATNSDLSEELQRFSLRAYSQSLGTKYIKPDKKLTEKLFEMAEDTKFDQFQREETYLTIAQSATVEDTPRIAKLLKEKDFFWRQVGLRILMRVDGEGQLEKALKTKMLATTKRETADIIDWVAKFPKLTPTIRKLLKSKNLFIKAVCVYVLAANGKIDKDADALKALVNSKSKISKFKHKTLGQAAEAALKNLKEKG